MVVVQPAGWQEPEEDEQALESSEVEVRSLVVEVTQHGVRLDKALAEKEYLLQIQADLQEAEKKLKEYEALLKEGKSLPVDADVTQAKAALDTLKELFEGNRALFTGLAAESRWDWSTRHPVIRISFGAGVAKTKAELAQRMQEILRTNRERLGLPRPADWPEADTAGNLSHLIRQAHQTHLPHDHDLMADGHYGGERHHKEADDLEPLKTLVAQALYQRHNNLLRAVIRPVVCP